jgi:transposase
MKKQRTHDTPEEKVAILRRHLLDKEPISKLCDELGLPPTVFYRGSLPGQRCRRADTG